MDTQSFFDWQIKLSSDFQLQRNYRWEAKALHVEHRLQCLKKLKQWIENNQSQIIEVLNADFNKPPMETLSTEIFPTIGEISFLIDELPYWVKPQPKASGFLMLGAESEVRFEPKGNVLVISPWNYPFHLAVVPLAGALAAGNTVILKPSELTPATSKLIREMCEVLFKPELVKVIEGGAEVSEHLLTLPFDHIFFTGSTNVGRKVYQAAAKNLTPVTLELGGKSPVIVDKSANLQKAAKKIVWSKFLNGGQTCVAPDYLYIHKEVEAEFIEYFKSEIAAQHRDEQNSKSSMARAVSQRHAVRLSQMINEAKERGANVIHGGSCNVEDRFIEPTLISNVNYEMKLMTEEIFGPILPMLTFSDVNFVINEITTQEKPLALYVFSSDEEFVEAVLSRTSAGGCVVNDLILHLANHNLPFGGVGASGIGRYHGLYSLKEFSHEKAVMKKGPMSVFTSIVSSPYTSLKEAILKFVIRFQ
jgi:aldehyde dehydrogenase (NAD+)